jgi:hypothetical protein
MPGLVQVSGEGPQPALLNRRAVAQPAAHRNVVDDQRDDAAAHADTAARVDTAVHDDTRSWGQGSAASRNAATSTAA